MPADIQEALGKDGSSEVKVSKYQAFSGRIQRRGQQSTIRSENGGCSSSRTVHQETRFCRHGLDTLLRDDGRGVENERLRFDCVDLG